MSVLFSTYLIDPDILFIEIKIVIMLTLKLPENLGSLNCFMLDMILDLHVNIY